MGRGRAKFAAHNKDYLQCTLQLSVPISDLGSVARATQANAIERNIVREPTHRMLQQQHLQDSSCIFFYKDVLSYLTFIRLTGSWTAHDAGTAWALACEYRRAVAAVRAHIYALAVNAIIASSSPPPLRVR